LSKVIKNFDASTQASGTKALCLAEVGDEARQIMTTAQEKARQILYDAAVEADRLRRAAEEKGFAEGKAAVTAKIEAQVTEEIRQAHAREVAELVKTLQTVIRDVDQRRDRLVRESKEQLVMLAVNIARAVVKREVACSGEVAKLNLEAAVALSARRSKLVVRVSESDVETLRALLGENAPGSLMAGTDSAIELRPSSEIMPGGCLIESAAGSVDARIETQLREIEKVLLGEAVHG
jgi:flagellar assembly protein FliH